MRSKLNTIQFELPTQLACAAPTEQRNIARDEVRLLVTQKSGQVAHTIFRNLPEYLQPGDVLVVNTSATTASAFKIVLPDGNEGMVHLSTKINEQEWLVEVREIAGDKTVRWAKGKVGMEFYLPGENKLLLKRKFYKGRGLLHLWAAELIINQDLEDFIGTYGMPIKYYNLHETYPLDYYQTFFSFKPGSAEMPSAARGFTQNLVNRLLSKGILFAPILLHTGVSSLEENERPYPEYIEIDSISSAVINHAKSNGSRVIAVGTTAVRAIESAVNQTGQLIPYCGMTDLVIERGHDFKITDGLLTGFHEPKASHLHMLQSLAGYRHIEQAYKLAIAYNYFWHQFGDLHLILP